MAATIVDIKNRTGLALATISKYLNGGNVLPENREKIEAAIKELDYKVNEVARSLVTRRSKTIGVVVFDISSMFNGTLLKYIGDDLREHGYGMLIVDSSQNEQNEKNGVEFLLSKQVDGIIAIPVSHSSDFFAPAKAEHIPVVLIDRIVEDEKTDCVRINNRKAAYGAVKLLIEKSHKKIGIISSEIEYTGIERFNGFIDAMSDAKLPVSDEYIVKGMHSMEFGYVGMKKLLSLKDRPTAVFMTNYEISLGALIAVKESNLKCPDDISIMGFDDLLVTQILDPALYTVVQPLEEMSRKAVDRVLERIEKDEEFEPTEFVLETHMMEGNSIREI